MIVGFNVAMKMSVIELFEAAMDVGDKAKAAEAVAMLDALRPGELTPLLAAHRLRLRARLGAEGTAVETAFVESARRFGELGVRFYRACTLVELAEWQLATDSAADVSEIVGEAREIFIGYRVPGWLDRVARIEDDSSVSAASA
jgi:hypothetical protein